MQDVSHTCIKANSSTELDFGNCNIYFSFQSSLVKFFPCLPRVCDKSSIHQDGPSKACIRNCKADLLSNAILGNLSHASSALDSECTIHRDGGECVEIGNCNANATPLGKGRICSIEVLRLDRGNVVVNHLSSNGCSLLTDNSWT